MELLLKLALQSYQDCHENLADLGRGQIMKAKNSFATLTVITLQEVPIP